MIMAFDFRVNFLRLQLAGGQACTLVRDLKLFSVISRSETAMVREWSVDQRKFLLKRKLQGATLAVIQQDYAYWWPPHTWHITNAPAPASKSTLKRLNNHHQAMVSEAVYCMKKKARKCLRAMGGAFEGRCV